MKVTIVGAGFSGLTLAYFLVKRGVDVEIYEKQAEAGGLLHTRHEVTGLAETAANGILNSVLLEELFADIGIALAVPKKTRSRRFIFRRRPRRWPLSLSETVKLTLKIAFAWSTRRLRPGRGEAVKEWGERVGGLGFSRFLLGPALQGVYAGDPSKMSAGLILGPMFERSERKPKLRGTVAPAQGMEEIVARLTLWLRNHGVKFQFSATPKGMAKILVVATSAWDAADFLRSRDAEAAALLSRAEALPLVSATLFFDDTPTRYRGFGCLFPAEERFQSLGVLFNTDIFEGRGSGRSETWILGGALNREVLNRNEDELIKRILNDRRRVFNSNTPPAHFVIQRWPKALPHYTLAWNETLSQLRLPSGLYLTGNYLGAIGLSRILQYNKNLAEKIHA